MSNFALRGLFLLFAAILFGPNTHAAEQVLRYKSWLVTAEGPINCADRPALTIVGKGKLLNDPAEMRGLAAELAGVLAPKCPDLREVIVFERKTQQLLSLPRPAAAPTPPRPAAPVAETPPARAPARRAATAPASPPPPGRRAADPQPLRNRAEPPSPPARAIPERIRTITPAPQTKISLAGTWIGIYQIYPSYVQMTLTIAAEPGANGEAQANLRLEGLDGGNAPHMGVTPASIRFHPGSLALDIQAVADPRNRNYQLSRLQFHAVYDTSRQTFAGVRVGASTDASPYLLLVRQGQERQLFEPFKDIPTGNQRVTPFSQVRIGGSAPSEDELRTWASQIYKEYPDIRPYHTQLGALFVIARNLFRDEYFTAYFGKPYDQLGGSDMGKIWRRLEGLPAPRANFPEDRGNAAARPLAGGFWTNVGTNAVADMMLSVVGLRSISAWMDQTERRLPAIPPAAGAFNTLNQIESEEQAVLSTLWPSERETFLKAIDAQRARLADPVLTENVNQLVSSATSFPAIPSLQSALTSLRQPPAASSAPRTVARNAGRRGVPAAAMRRAAAPNGEDIPSLAAMASPAVRQDLGGAVEVKIAALVDAEAANDGAAIATFPAGPAGLEKGAQWHAAMDRKYATFKSTPPVSGLFEKFQQKRAQQFTGASPELKTLIAGLNSKAEIQSALSRYAGLPTDRGISPAKLVFLAAKEREVELARLATERAQREAQEAARKAREALEAAESRWRRRKPAPTEIIRVGLADMYPQPNATPIEQAISSVVAVLLPDGHGSAFVITKDGLAITNNHVVEGETAMKARFADGQEFAARVWRTDPDNDFALIQIDCPTDCFTSYVTDEPLPSPGTEIFVIGTPRDPKFSNSVTKGIVSGLRRNGGKTDIQSDAAMNGGNSGGPMVDAETGRVIGVVTWKRTDADGLGFAGSILDALRTLGVSLQ